MKWLEDLYQSRFIDRLLAETKLVDWAQDQLRARKISIKGEKSGWERIPNIKSFKIKLGRWHPLLRTVGIYKRLPNTLKFKSLSSDRAQRYMKYNLYRLQQLRGNPTKYWNLSWFLMRHSNAFRVSAIQHVFPNWYKKYSFYFILNTNRKAERILKTRNLKLEYDRIYLLKPNGKYRPLGVPRPEWRLVLHMLNNFIHWYSYKAVLSSQHGFIPGRGTLTAWKQLLTSDLLYSPYIYECDLRNFFNEISLDYLDQRLQELRFPRRMIQLLRALNSNAPNLPKEHAVDESASLQKASDAGRAWNLSGPLSNKSLLLPLESQGGGRPYFNIDHPNFNKELREEVLRGIQNPSDRIIPLNKISWWKGHKGLPQGAATSPYLSLLVMRKFLTQQQSISYADDPIFFGKSPFQIVDDPMNGLELSQEKSGWIKYNGKWLKELKFLGITYNGLENTLRASTHNGATLEVKGDIKDMLLAIEEWDRLNGLHDVGGPDSDKRVLHSWKRLWSHKFAGFIQACMYKNNWTDKFYQDFELKWKGSSWLAIQPSRSPTWSTFTVSSYASHSLLNTLRKGKVRGKVFTGVRFTYPRGRPRKSDKE